MRLPIFYFSGGDMKKSFVLASLLAVSALILVACGGGGSQASDLLGAIKERGYILVSTDPNYAPQSFLNTEGSRPADTKCPGDALTTSEMQGFDVDVAKAIGDDLGVETCFATPSWDTITAGNWADKWDISVGSMTITPDRREILDFSVPYYYTPAAVAVRADADFATLEDLAGQALCAGTATTYETWLNGGDLGPEIEILAQAPEVTIISLETDQECAQAISAGREDFVGYVTSSTVIYANLAEDFPVKFLGTPVYNEPLAAALDKSASLPTATLLEQVNNTFTRMHSDGTLTNLSKNWFKDNNGEGVDYTKAE
jgi:polar amino acid transport system substrate-binding protein